MASDREGPSTSGPSRLNGWKEIANHLGKSVRAVQRWERELGLPVHRLGANTKIVFADRRELDQWMEANSRGVQQTANEPEPARPRIWRWILAVAALVVLTVTGTIIWKSVVIPRRTITRYEVGNGLLHVFNVYGDELFTHPFGFRLSDKEYAAWRAASPDCCARFVDTNEDGLPELLFAAYTGAGDPAEGFYALDYTGREIWKVIPDDSLEFNSTPYSAPWHPHVMTLGTEPSSALRIYLGFIHYSRSVSGLFTVDAKGKVLSKYWQDGYIESIVLREWLGRPSVFLGGTNDESRGGSLAIFQGAAPTGSAPAQDPSRACARGCQAGWPDQFLVVPQGEFARLEPGGGKNDSGSSSATKVAVDSKGEIEIDVSEGASDGSGHVLAVLKCRISPDMVVLAADPTAGYVVEHGRKEAVLGHVYDRASHLANWWFPVLTFRAGTWFVQSKPNQPAVRLTR